MARSPRRPPARRCPPRRDRTSGHARSSSNLLRSLRPRQWTKNLFVFAGLIFGEKLRDPDAVGQALAGVRGVLPAVGRGLPHQRRARPRGRPAAPGQVAAADRLGRAVARPRRSRPRPFSSVALAVAAFSINRAFGLVAATYLALLGALLAVAQARRHPRRADARGRLRAARGRRRGRDRRRVQPLAPAADAAARAVPGAQQAPRRAGRAGRRRAGPSPEPGRLQPVPARPDDRRRDGVHAAGLRVLHDQPGDGGEVRHRPPALHGAVSALRHLPVPLSGAPARGRRQPVGDAADRSAAAALRRALGRGGDRDSVRPWR